ncbi:MAG: hypothetical protein ACKOEM_16730 [Planctomycetia bacterium]
MMTRLLLRPMLLTLAAAAACGWPLAHGESVDLESIRDDLMRPSQVVATAPIDREGLSGRVLCGYQGWFAAEGDGAGLGWRHWRKRDPSAPGGTRFSVDMLRRRRPAPGRQAARGHLGNRVQGSP